MVEVENPNESTLEFATDESKPPEEVLMQALAAKGFRISEREFFRERYLLRQQINRITAGESTNGQ